MEVRATATGFYKKIRTPNERFEIPDHLFSKTWMERVEEGDDGKGGGGGTSSSGGGKKRSSTGGQSGVGTASPAKSPSG